MMPTFLPIGLTPDEMRTLLYALNIAVINCHESNADEIEALLRRVRLLAAAYGADHE